MIRTTTKQFAKVHVVREGAYHGDGAWLPTLCGLQALAGGCVAHRWLWTPFVRSQDAGGVRGPARAGMCGNCARAWAGGAR